MIEVKDLFVDIQLGSQVVQAVRGVSFEIGRRETVGLVGESGSGKSVTASALLRLWNPPQGKVRGSIMVNETDAMALKPSQLPSYRHRHFGYISQEPSQSFDPLYTIEKNFHELFRLKNPKITLAQTRQKATELLQEVGIARPLERLKGFPHQFSGGMLQRIMIALALGGEGELLIADEPTTALDVTVQAQIVKLLLDLQEKRGFSILFISHDLDLVSSISQRIFVMYGGLILESATSEEIRQDPLSPYTQELLKSLPPLGAHYREKECHFIPGTPVDPVKPPLGCPFAPRCPYVMRECEKNLPPLQGDSHLYRCLLPEKELQQRRTHGRK